MGFTTQRSLIIARSETTKQSSEIATAAFSRLAMMEKRKILESLNVTDKEEK